MTDNKYTEITVLSSLEKVRDIEEQILDGAIKVGYNAADMFAIKLCLEEALTNAVRHGNCGDSTKMVTVRYCICDTSLEVFVEDQGKGFNPEIVPDPRSEENLSRPGGRGLLLMRSYMDTLDYIGRGNIVHMVKKRSM